MCILSTVCAHICLHPTAHYINAPSPTCLYLSYVIVSNDILSTQPHPVQSSALEWTLHAKVLSIVVPQNIPFVTMRTSSTHRGVKLGDSTVIDTVVDIFTHILQRVYVYYLPPPPPPPCPRKCRPTGIPPVPSHLHGKHFPPQPSRLCSTLAHPHLYPWKGLCRRCRRGVAEPGRDHLLSPPRSQCRTFRYLVRTGVRRFLWMGKGEGGEH